jgi:hypothetical protein
LLLGKSVPFGKARDFPRSKIDFRKAKAVKTQ